MALAAIQLATRSRPPGRGRTTAPHLRALPARDPGRPGQRRAAVRRGRLRAGRGGPPHSASPPRCSAAPMLVVAVLGLAANLVAFALLREGSKESINVEGAYLEVLADTLGSVGVIVAAVVIQAARLDVGRPGGGRRHRRCGSCPAPGGSAARRCGILVQAAPRRPRRRPGSSPTSAALAGVVDVHDLHVWTLTSEMDVASAHLMVGAGDRHPRRARPGPRPAARRATGSATPPSRWSPTTTRLRRGRLVGTVRP